MPLNPQRAAQEGTNPLGGTIPPITGFQRLLGASEGKRQPIYHRVVPDEASVPPERSSVAQKGTIRPGWGFTYPIVIWA